MGDKLVREVMESLKGVAFANGHTLSEPVIDALVNRMREAALSDDYIRALLCPEVGVTIRAWDFFATDKIHMHICTMDEESGAKMLLDAKESIVAMLAEARNK